jgi:hypothetical protein
MVRQLSGAGCEPFKPSCKRINWHSYEAWSTDLQSVTHPKTWEIAGLYFLYCIVFFKWTFKVSILQSPTLFSVWTTPEQQPVIQPSADESLERFSARDYGTDRYHSKRNRYNEPVARFHQSVIFIWYQAFCPPELPNRKFSTNKHEYQKSARL